MLILWNLTGGFCIKMSYLLSIFLQGPPLTWMEWRLSLPDIKYASPSSPITLNIVRSVGLGNVPNHPLHSGRASRICTGGYLPPRADTVVPVEQTRIVSKNKVAILSSLSKGFFYLCFRNGC